MKRRVLCLILAVIMVACLLPTAAFASTNGKTADDAINWVKSLEGQPVGSGECVALIVAYYSYLGQTSPGGNGADYSWNQLPAGWTRIQNAQPQKGDILVYSGNAANKYGHVAIYESDYSTWHQNYAYQRKVVHVTNVRYNGFDNPYWGVIRPDFSSPTPTPSYADIGTNVYRYLIRTDGWKHIGTNYGSNNYVTISAANTGDPEQIWKFIRQGDGSYYIQNMYSDWSLTYEGDCVQQAKVTVSWLNTNKASRFQWYIYDKNGTFQLVPKDSVTAGTWLVLDCTGNYQTAGTQMELYSNWSGAAQIFSLYPVDYQKPAAPPKVEITVPEVVTVGEEVKISWTASPLRDKYDQREYCVTVEGGGSKKVIYTTDTSVSVTIKRRELHCNVTVDARNTKYASYSSSSYASFRCVEAHEHSYTAVVTAPTCTEKGYTTHTCSRCGDSYVDSETPALGHKCAAYTDIPTDWAKEGICFVIENGLMVGTTSTTFAPKDTLTRAMLVTVLYRMAGSPAVDAPSGFTDVADGQWYSDAIAWAAANGIVNGVGGNKFAPSEPVTREQLAAIFFRYAKAEAPEADVLSGYPDAESVSTYARDAMAWAVSTGLVTGSKEADGTYLVPQGLAAREQAAAILMRYVKANA